MGFAAVWQKLEISLDNAGQAVGLSDAQSEAILLERARRSVPEFGESLRGVAEAHSLPDQRLQRSADDWVLRIIFLANAQKNIAVEKTRTTGDH